MLIQFNTHYANPISHSLTHLTNPIVKRVPTPRDITNGTHRSIETDQRLQRTGLNPDPNLNLNPIRMLIVIHSIAYVAGLSQLDQQYLLLIIITCCCCCCFNIFFYIICYVPPERVMRRNTAPSSPNAWTYAAVAATHAYHMPYA